VYKDIDRVTSGS